MPVSVSAGLSERDAVALWERNYAEPIVMLYRARDTDYPIQLHPDQVGWRISSEPMLAAALASGEQGGGFWRRFLDFLLGIEQTVARDIALIADYQENALEAILQEISLRYDRAPVGANYDLQTLTVYAGASGYALDLGAAMAAADDALAPLMSVPWPSRSPSRATRDQICVRCVISLSIFLTAADSFMTVLVLSRPYMCKTC